jgi:hypothetical protein
MLQGAPIRGYPFTAGTVRVVHSGNLGFPGKSANKPESEMQFDFSGLIPIAGGTYALLAAFRVIRLSKNPADNELWLQKFGLAMKIIGPIVILFGLAEFFGLFG